MKRTTWTILATGVFAITSAACSIAVFAEEASPPAAETNELKQLLDVLDGPAWNRFIEDTTQALKDRAQDEEGRKETAEAIDSGIRTLNEMLKRAVAVADALQHSTDTPEFEAWKERVQKDLSSAAESLKQVDPDGILKMLEAVSREVSEPLEIVAEQAEEHFGEDDEAE